VLVAGAGLGLERIPDRQPPKILPSVVVVRQGPLARFQPSPACPGPLVEGPGGQSRVGDWPALCTRGWVPLPSRWSVTVREFFLPVEQGPVAVFLVGGERVDESFLD
jgi:hypothetical protein